MKTEIAGITRANEGIQGISWNILGQTYVPKNVTEHSFSWHATFPPETFVPPHIHPDQDEYLYILEGQLDFFLDGADTQATPGDLVRLPMGKPHGIFNKSQQNAKTLFWVSPTRRLYELFWAIHNMREQKPDDVVKLAAAVHDPAKTTTGMFFDWTITGNWSWQAPADAFDEELAARLREVVQQAGRR